MDRTTRTFVDEVDEAIDNFLSAEVVLFCTSVRSLPDCLLPPPDDFFSTAAPFSSPFFLPPPLVDLEFLPPLSSFLPPVVPT